MTQSHQGGKQHGVHGEGEMAFFHTATEVTSPIYQSISTITPIHQSVNCDHANLPVDQYDHANPPIGQLRPRQSTSRSVRSLKSTNRSTATTPNYQSISTITPIHQSVNCDHAKLPVWKIWPRQCAGRSKWARRLCYLRSSSHVGLINNGPSSQFRPSHRSCPIS